MFFAPLLVIVALVILSTAFIMLYLSSTKLEGKVGLTPLKIMLAEQETDKALTFIDESAKEAATQAVYDIGQNGGFDTRSICGYYGGFVLWKQDDSNCFPEVLGEFIGTYSRDLDIYFYSYPWIVIPRENYVMSMFPEADTIRIIGDDLSPIYYSFGGYEFDLEENTAKMSAGHSYTPYIVPKSAKEKLAAVETNFIQKINEEIGATISSPAPYSDPAVPRTDQRDRYDIKPSPELVMGIIMQESGGNPSARSPTGCMGLMQFCSAAAIQYGLCDRNGCRIRDDRTNAELAIAAGVRMISDLMDRFSEYELCREELAVASYNGGSGVIQKAVKRAMAVYDVDEEHLTWKQVEASITPDMITYFKKPGQKRQKVDEIQKYVIRVEGYKKKFLETKLVDGALVDIVNDELEPSTPTGAVVFHATRKDVVTGNVISKLTGNAANEPADDKSSEEDSEQKKIFTGYYKRSPDFRTVLDYNIKSKFNYLDEKILLLAETCQPEIQNGMDELKDCIKSLMITPKLEFETKLADPNDPTTAVPTEYDWLIKFGDEIVTSEKSSLGFWTEEKDKWHALCETDEELVANDFLEMHDRCYYSIDSECYCEYPEMWLSSPFAYDGMHQGYVEFEDVTLDIEKNVGTRVHELKVFNAKNQEEPVYLTSAYLESRTPLGTIPHNNYLLPSSINFTLAEKMGQLEFPSPTGQWKFFNTLMSPYAFKNLLVYKKLSGEILIGEDIGNNLMEYADNTARARRALPGDKCTQPEILKVCVVDKSRNYYVFNRLKQETEKKSPTIKFAYMLKDKVPPEPIEEFQVFDRLKKEDSVVLKWKKNTAGVNSDIEKYKFYAVAKNSITTQMTKTTQEINDDSASAPQEKIVTEIDLTTTGNIIQERIDGDIDLLNCNFDYSQKKCKYDIYSPNQPGGLVNTLPVKIGEVFIEPETLYNFINNPSDISDEGYYVYLLEGYSDGKEYDFGITALDEVPNEITNEPDPNIIGQILAEQKIPVFSFTPVDDLAPDVVTNVVVRSVGQNVVVNWEATTQNLDSTSVDDLLGYNVYTVPACQQMPSVTPRLLSGVTTASYSVTLLWNFGAQCAGAGNSFVMNFVVVAQDNSQNPATEFTQEMHDTWKNSYGMMVEPITINRP